MKKCETRKSNENPDGLEYWYDHQSSVEDRSFSETKNVSVSGKKKNFGVEEFDKAKKAIGDEFSNAGRKHKALENTEASLPKKVSITILKGDNKGEVVQVDKNQRKGMRRSSTTRTLWKAWKTAKQRISLAP